MARFKPRFAYPVASDVNVYLYDDFADKWYMGVSYAGNKNRIAIECLVGLNFFTKGSKSDAVAAFCHELGHYLFEDDVFSMRKPASDRLAKGGEIRADVWSAILLKLLGMDPTLFADLLLKMGLDDNASVDMNMEFPEYPSYSRRRKIIQKFCANMFRL